MNAEANEPGTAIRRRSKMEIDHFIFNQEQEEIDENDDVIGCQKRGRICICNTCGKDDCIYPGSMRGEVI